MRSLGYLFALMALGALSYLTWRGRQERLQEEKAARDAIAAKSATQGVEDMRSCEKCGAYVPVSNGKSCGKAGCPMGAA